MAKVQFGGTAHFFMKSGNSFDVHCDAVSVQAQNGQIIKCTIAGYHEAAGAPLSVNSHQIEAIVWDGIPVKIRVKANHTIKA